MPLVVVVPSSPDGATESQAPPGAPQAGRCQERRREAVGECRRRCLWSRASVQADQDGEIVGRLSGVIHARTSHRTGTRPRGGSRSGVSSPVIAASGQWRR